MKKSNKDFWSWKVANVRNTVSPSLVIFVKGGVVVYWIRHLSYLGLSWGSAWQVKKLKH